MGPVKIRNRARIALTLVVACAVSGSPRARTSASSRLPTPDAGLEVETVTAIHPDRAGFLWIGSREGLIRYDGYTSVEFQHDASNPESLSDNSIRTIEEDHEGVLWIGTNAGGINRLDPVTWKFKSYRHAASDPGSLVNDSVYAVAEDRDGKLWVGTQGGLNRFDPATGHFERFPAGPSGPEGDYVTALLVGKSGELWVATLGGGLSRRDPASGSFATFRHDRADPRSLPDDRVFAVAEDGSGNLWLGTASGPCRLDRGTRTFEAFPFPVGAESGAAFTSGVIVTAEQGVWASSLDHGLFVFDGTSKRFVRRPFRPGIPGGARTRIVALSGDRQGNVWVGTWGNGLGQATRESRSIVALDAPITGSNAPDVTAVLEDSRGRLWIGDIDSTLRAIGGEPTPTVPVPGTPISLAEDSRGGLCIGTTAGLTHLDVAKNKLTDVPLGRTPSGEPARAWIWSTRGDGRGRLWVAAGEAGLLRLHPDGAIDRFPYDAGNPNGPSDGYVTAVLPDRAGTVWVGTRSGGLDAFDEAAGRWSRYLPDPDDPRSLSHVNVTALLEARDGTLWVGTGGAGLNRLERDQGTGRVAFTRISESDWLIDNNVVSLVEDSDGSIWIGTRRGLSRLDPALRTFESIGTEDGLPSGDLHIGAAATGRDSLYFGTHRGVVVVARGTPFPAQSASPIAITSIRTPAGALELDRPPWEATHMAVPYGRIVSFEFATLDYGDRRRHRYAYKLEPSDDDWIDLGARREVTFTGLEPGSHTLRIRGRNDQGVWSEAEHPLAIAVVPPFWMTGWFRALSVFALATATVGIHLWRTARLTRRNRELTRLKEQREVALAEADASQRALSESYRRLRTLGTRLDKAKEEERKWLARELHDELGTGLTTTKLVLQLLSESSTPAEREKRMGEAIGLLDRMIGHSRALSVDLRPPLLDELGLAAALQGYVESLSRRARLDIGLDTEDLPRKLPEDTAIAGFRVVQESLNNVVRHAEAKRADVNVRYDSGWLDIRVRDDGNGFDVDAALERSAAGGHAGLAGMKERVTSMGGDLAIRAAAGGGTEIHARLPAES